MKLTKHHLNVAAFASTDKNRYGQTLKCLHITLAHVEATDGRFLMRHAVGAGNGNGDDGSDGGGSSGNGNTFEPWLMPADEAIRIARATSAKDGLATLAPHDGGPTFTAQVGKRLASPKQVQTITGNALPGRTGMPFPDLDRAIPSASALTAPTTIRVGLNAAMLEAVAKHFRLGGKNTVIEITVTSPEDPVKFSGHDELGNAITAVIMPYKLP